jgi:cystathionine beta-lyase
MQSFNQLHNRKNTRSVKWDLLQPVFQADDILPMWVADMDFKSPDAVNEAIIDRAKHGIWGYTIIDNDLKDPIVNWLHKRHGWHIDASWLSFSPGVVTTLHMAIEAFTEPNDQILIQTPVYTPFYEVIKKHQRKIVKNSLILKDNSYQIDFNDFEKKIQQGVKAFILCSPHNPVGRVWTKTELLEMARLCLKYDVLILSDEIHSDLIYPNYQHIPIASLYEEISQQTITCMSPSKTFNMAGLQASYIVTENKSKRIKLQKHLQKYGLSHLNTIGNIGLEAAYKYGEEWLDRLMIVLNENKNYVINMLEKHTNDLKVIRPEGTYLMWIDCSSLQLDSRSLHKFMIEKAKVGLNQGISYGEEGNQFMRINIACPPSTLKEGISRMITAVNNR